MNEGKIPEAKAYISNAEANFLYGLAKGVCDGCIVEVGSFHGCSTSALARGSDAGGKAPVYAFDPHEEYVGQYGEVFGPESRGMFYRTMLATGCYRTVRLVNLGSSVVAPGWDKPIGLLFLDGDHSYEGVKRDFEAWRPHLVPGARVAFHDALDPKLGPMALIKELLAEGEFGMVAGVGLTVVLVLREEAQDELHEAGFKV